MPGFIEAITFLVVAAQAGALGAGVAAVGAAYAGIVGVSLSIGVSYLSSLLFKPKQPQPEDVQTSVKNPTAARVRHYGRVKTSGPWVFCDTIAGWLHKVIATGTGELDAIEEYWIDDAQVTVDGTGLVQTFPWVNDGSPICRIQVRRGLSTETHYDLLEDAFPEWTPDHRGDGVSSAYIVQAAVEPERLSNNFPNLSQTVYRFVVRGAKIFNPISGLVEWDDGAAAVIRDYFTHPDGMRMPTALVGTPLATAGWLAAANRCAELVSLKDGGTEKRYRLWGSYGLNERPADVLGRMLLSCDARLVPTPDGGITLDVGTWAEPTVVIDADAIAGFDVAKGRDIITTANVISATYMSPNHDYQAIDADRWLDDEDVARRGEIVSDASFIMAPSHSQCRRLMKLAAYRANPEWIGSFKCNLRGLAAFGERFVRIQYPLFGIDEVFEVKDFKFDIGDGGLLIGVTLEVQSMPAEAYYWNAPTEEGTEPENETTTVDPSLPVPTGLSFGVDRITVGSTLVPFGIITFDAPPVQGLKAQGRYKLTASSDWNVIPIGDGEVSGQTPALSDGSTYEAQVRFVTITGRQGDWTSSVNLTPVADASPPGGLTGVVGTGGVGQVALSWVSPNSANYTATNIRRHTANVEGSAVLVRTEYGPPSTSDSYTDSALAPGTYYYWLKARNASGVESSSVATGATTVT